MTDCDEDLFCDVNYADKEPGEMDVLEKKHTPVVEVEKVGKNTYEVTVKVGEYKDHPNENSHFIESIELYSGNAFLGRARFASARSDPEATFRVKLCCKHPLVAFARCNMHGTWRSDAKEV